MHNDCVGNSKRGCMYIHISMVRGERRCGTGIHGVRSGVEGAMRSYARGFDSLMIRLDLNTIRGILRRKEGEFGPM